MSDKMQDYREIRGIIKRKYKNIFGKYIFVIADKDKEVSLFVGKGLYEMYNVKEQVTVGHIKKKLINIRPGIVK